MQFAVEYECEEGKGSYYIYGDNLIDAAIAFKQEFSFYKSLKILSIVKMANKCEYCYKVEIPDSSIVCAECEELIYQPVELKKNLLGMVSSHDIMNAKKEEAKRAKFRDRLCGKTK